MKRTYIVLLLILLGGWFYWFQWLPTQIRKKCYLGTFGVVNEWIGKNKEGENKWAPGKLWMEDPNVHVDAFRGIWPKWGWYYDIPNSATVENWFNSCLRSNGIKI